MITNIHEANTIKPEIHHSQDGRGWLTFKIKRTHWSTGDDMEEVQVNLFTEDIKKLSFTLSEAILVELCGLEKDLAKE